MLLFDAKPPRRRGARRRPWRGLRLADCSSGRSFARPWLLAGGLDPDNVARAIAASGAPGVDVSSGVETAPGVKERRSDRRIRRRRARAGTEARA